MRGSDYHIMHKVKSRNPRREREREQQQYHLARRRCSLLQLVTLSCPAKRDRERERSVYIYTPFTSRTQGVEGAYSLSLPPFYISAPRRHTRLKPISYSTAFHSFYLQCRRIDAFLFVCVCVHPAATAQPATWHSLLSNRTSCCLSN